MPVGVGAQWIPAWRPLDVGAVVDGREVQNRMPEVTARAAPEM
jgi:hypothetical protein